MSDHIIDVSELRTGISASETVTIIQKQRARTLAERVLLVFIAAYSGTGTWQFEAFRQDDANLHPAFHAGMMGPASSVRWFVFLPITGLQSHVFPTTVDATLTGVSTIDYQIFMMGRDPF